MLDSKIDEPLLSCVFWKYLIGHKAVIAGYLKHLKADLWNILLLWEYFLGSPIVTVLESNITTTFKNATQVIILKCINGNFFIKPIRFLKQSWKILI